MKKSNTNTKKYGITYDELMKSPILDFPEINYFLYKLFSLTFVILFSLFFAFAFSFYKTKGDLFLAFFIGLLSLTPILKMYAANCNMTGHGVGIIKKQKLSVFGLSSIAVIMYSIIGILIITLLVSPTDNENVDAFAVSMFVSYIMGLLYWRLHQYYDTWYGSEYDARIEFQQRGLTQDQISERIFDLKKKGVIK